MSGESLTCHRQKLSASYPTQEVTDLNDECRLLKILSVRTKERTGEVGHTKGVIGRQVTLEGS